MRAKALLIAGGKEPVAEVWDYSVKPITGNELSTTGKNGFEKQLSAWYVAEVEE